MVACTNKPKHRLRPGFTLPSSMMLHRCTQAEVQKKIRTDGENCIRNTDALWWYVWCPTYHSWPKFVQPSATWVENVQPSTTTVAQTSQKGCVKWPRKLLKNSFVMRFKVAAAKKSRCAQFLAFVWLVQALGLGILDRRCLGKPVQACISLG